MFDIDGGTETGCEIFHSNIEGKVWDLVRLTLLVVMGVFRWDITHLECCPCPAVILKESMSIRELGDMVCVLVGGNMTLSSLMVSCGWERDLTKLHGRASRPGPASWEDSFRTPCPGIMVIQANNTVSVS